MDEMLDKMSLTELSDLTRDVLSRIYCKLREDEGFGYDQHCSVLSIGENEYDVQAVIIDGVHNPGIDWPQTWWI